jgi:hypothetical protein
MASVIDDQGQVAGRSGTIAWEIEDDHTGQREVGDAGRKPDIGTPDPWGTDRSNEGWRCLMRPSGRNDADRHRSPVAQHAAVCSGPHGRATRGM